MVNKILINSYSNLNLSQKEKYNSYATHFSLIQLLFIVYLKKKSISSNSLFKNLQRIIKNIKKKIFQLLSNQLLLRS